MKSLNNRRNQSSSPSTKQIDLKTTSIQELYNMAEQYYSKLSSAHSDKWTSIISRAGTRKDKVSLMATQIIKNPHTSLQQFEQLVSFCFDQNHHFALDACQTLVNIYHDYVFADKKSLRMFLDSVQAQIKEAKNKSVIVFLQDLVGYYLEHQIKHYYSELIRSIELLLVSTIPFVKKTAISLLTSLTRHGELRRMIIRILINKFGDRDMQIVNLIYKSLKTQFYQDLQSSSILLQESQSFLFRPNISQKSQFYVINYLNNLNIKFLDEKGLSKLFELFYHFFQKLMGQNSKEGSISSRLFLNSIKGLNRIFNFIKGGNKSTRELIESKIQSVYRIVHQTTNTKAKIQLYLFLFQYHSHIHGNLTDRFYRSLYDFISHDEILHCSLAELFFDLVLISIKQDENINRQLAFIKRMLQLCLTAQANFITTTLLMIGKILQEKESLRIVIHQKENCLGDESDEIKKYDSTKREPIYAGAETTLLWELTVFANHYHPTVRKFATHIIKAEVIPYDGANPMLEMSTANFLQKLVLKKERKSEGWKLKMSKNLSKIRKAKYETLVDKPLEDFREDEQFIKKYLQQRSKIHTNFKSRQPADIEEFADQVIQKEMDRLNPKNEDEEVDLSMSDMQEGQEQQQFQQEQGEQQEQLQEEEDQNKFEEDQFGSDGQGIEEDQYYGQQNQVDEFDQDIQQDSQMQEVQSQQKQFQEAFNEIGNDDQEYPKKRGNSFRSRPLKKARKVISKPIKKALKSRHKKR